MKKRESEPKGHRDFRHAEVPILQPDRQLIVGQVISISPVKEGSALAAIVRKISPDQIWLDLAMPTSQHPMQEGEQVRIKSWNEDEAFYFESKILKVFGSTNEQLEISIPREGVAIQRRKTYRVQGPIPFSFTIIEAAETQLIGQEVPGSEIRNLTVGGLAFDTSLPLKGGDKLDMNLQLSPSQQVNAVGSVIRCSPVEQDGKSLNSAAVKFFQLDVEAQRTLLMFLAQSGPRDDELDTLSVG